MNSFCLKQGQGWEGSTAHFYPNFAGAPRIETSLFIIGETVKTYTLSFVYISVLFLILTCNHS